MVNDKRILLKKGFQMLLKQATEEKFNEWLNNEKIGFSKELKDMGVSTEYPKNPKELDDKQLDQLYEAFFTREMKYWPGEYHAYLRENMWNEEVIDLKMSEIKLPVLPVEPEEAKEKPKKVDSKKVVGKKEKPKKKIAEKEEKSKVVKKIESKKEEFLLNGVGTGIFWGGTGGAVLEALSKGGNIEEVTDNFIEICSKKGLGSSNYKGRVLRMIAAVRENNKKGNTELNVVRDSDGNYSLKIGK